MQRPGSRVMIDARVLQEKIQARITITPEEDPGGRRARDMQIITGIIDDLAARVNTKHQCSECLDFIDQKTNKRGTLLGHYRHKKGTCFDRVIYGSSRACVRFKGCDPFGITPESSDVCKDCPDHYEPTEADLQEGGCGCKSIEHTGYCSMTDREER